MILENKIREQKAVHFFIIYIGCDIEQKQISFAPSVLLKLTAINASLVLIHTAVFFQNNVGAHWPVNWYMVPSARD